MTLKAGSPRREADPPPNKGAAMARLDESDLVNEPGDLPPTTDDQSSPPPAPPEADDEAESEVTVA